MPRTLRFRTTAASVVLLSTLLSSSLGARGRAPHPAGAHDLGPDAIVNNRALSICTCQGRPLNQVDPSIAAWGPYVLASWWDRRSTCAPNSPAQSHGWSMDHGATFREGQLLRGDSTDAFNGQASVAVNKKTGDFYISGLLRQGTSSSNVGIIAVRGRFGPDSFAIDRRKRLATQPAGEFIDRGAITVDSLSGDVYATWSYYLADGTSQVRLQRLDAALDPVGPVRVVATYPPGVDVPSTSFPIVGPRGELYVVYILFHQSPAEFNDDPSSLRVLRSDDGGLTFGPSHHVAEFHHSLLATPPGSQRTLFFPTASIAIDGSNGPHRGRLYAAWAENRPFTQPEFRDTVLNESEINDFFVRANPFTPGMKIRGEFFDPETDIFEFTGERGQTFYATSDSGQIAYRLRLLCSRDTTSIDRFHLLYGRSPTSPSSGPIVCGLPYDGTYYLHLQFPFTGQGAYMLRTGLVPAYPSARSRDFRDVFLSWSDDGATWSPPVRLNDDPAWFDNVHPQVAVDGRGRVHAFWLDRRDDPECGTSSSQYGVSSGDGGVTWGPNRRLSDASSFWGHLASCATNNIGDFMHMAAEGDHVYSIFPDSRRGDPDVFVDASAYGSAGVCPRDTVLAPTHQVSLEFSLANGGNFATPLAWEVLGDAGWIVATTPSASGQATIAAGGAATVRVAVRPPGGCARDSTQVRFVTSDPAIPGHADTCDVFVHCDDSVPVLVSLAEQLVSVGRVFLRWRVQDAGGVTATVLRRDAAGAWIVRATPAIERSGRIDFEDREVPPGRHGYRLVVEHPLEGRFMSEAWVDVPGAELALDPVHPNPASGGALTLDFSLPSATGAAIEVYDMAGRRVLARPLRALAPGPHRIVLAEASRLSDGLYLVVLRHGGRSISRKAVLAR